MDFDTFTKNLALYKKYKQAEKDIKEELDLILYDMTGVKGISYDRTPNSFNPSQSALKSLEMVDKYSRKEEELIFTRKAIKQIEITLAKMPKRLQAMLKDKFVYGMTYNQIALRYHYSNNGIWHYIKRETEKYL